MADYTNYGRWLKAQLAEYRATNRLKIDAGNHNRCERHQVRMERHRIGTSGKIRYTCPACMDELCAYQLRLSREWSDAAAQA